MSEIFNNREIAIGIWVLILIVLCLRKSSIRNSFSEVLNAFFKKPIVVSFVIMALYTFVIAYLLAKIKLWNVGQLKNTILWYICVASVSLFKLNSISEDPYYFKNELKSQIKLIVIIEFVVSFYSFSLLAEFFIIPFAVFIGALLAISERKEEHKPVAVIINNLLSCIGILSLIYCSYQLVTNFSDFAKIETLFDFIVPIILSVALLPLIFIMALYIRYEQILIKIHFYTDNKQIIRYGKLKALINFKLNHKELNKWLLSVCASDFESKEKIMSSIELYNEKQPSRLG